LDKVVTKKIKQLPNSYFLKNAFWQKGPTAGAKTMYEGGEV
jgi:hypothetical protein